MLLISEYKKGMTAELTREFSSDDVNIFSQLSGDINPVHLDDNYAKQTMFGARIVHGALVSSIFSTIFANTLPGAGCIYLKSENKFLKPIYLNEIVHFKVEVFDVISDRKKVIFKTSAISRNVECVVGTAELYIPN
ncbi:MaoC family dehydratase [Acinetobacter rongchengensis]|uniref:MaoC family dehydratase n=1 Tax=Acinetobacter rongchengensis TaxID=2419601 RepID=A0A3A8EQJ4_9GAMM|nr:MaoC family dehydratase [Acinetobacter rongchengensis]RKG36795.1 MaoC family dehydratase [Acinetobacter rongchengensis]